MSFPKSPRLPPHNKSSVHVKLFVDTCLDKSCFTRQKLVCEHCLAELLDLNYFLSHLLGVQAQSYCETARFGNAS